MINRRNLLSSSIFSLLPVKFTNANANTKSEAYKIFEELDKNIQSEISHKGRLSGVDLDISKFRMCEIDFAMHQNSIEIYGRTRLDGQKYSFSQRVFSKDLSTKFRKEVFENFNRKYGVEIFTSLYDPPTKEKSLAHHLFTGHKNILLWKVNNKISSLDKDDEHYKFYSENLSANYWYVIPEEVNIEKVIEILRKNYYCKVELR